MRNPSFKPLRSQAGTVMLESLLALVIFSVGILGLISLQAAQIRAQSENKYRIDASLAASRLLTQMWANPSELDSFAGSYTASSSNWLGAELPNASAVVSVADETATITISWSAGSHGSPRQYQVVAPVQSNSWE